ncbi:trehalase-like [Pogonomyrmex barbatus]|uniref:Trehalase n=1 Tax=Pogonomyrmex barbatus TaxID=144034 RepID=A0A8N1S615_9HYME|nr:trehalase-like [Pogonomyrmex barbatus]
MLHYATIASQYQAAIDNVLWNEEVGTWLDYDTRTKQSRNTFYPSNLSPLYTMSYDQNKSTKYAKRSISYLRKNKIDSYFGKSNRLPLIFLSHITD